MIGVLLALSIISILSIDTATAAQLPHSADVEQKQAWGNPDKDPNKTLGAFLGTKDTYSSKQAKNHIDKNLRTYIAKFIAPQSSHECPIDFLARATVIPEEWGTVHDIMADFQGNLKVLTCRLHRNSPKTARSSSSTTFASFKGLLYSGMCSSLSELTNKASNGLLIFSAALCIAYCYGKSISKAQYLPHYFGSCPDYSWPAFLMLGLGGRHMSAKLKDAASPIPCWEIAIYDLKKKAVEARHTIRQLFKPTQIYFLHNAHTIHIGERHSVTILRKSKYFNSFVEAEVTAATDYSLGLSISTARGYELSTGILAQRRWSNHIVSAIHGNIGRTQATAEITRAALGHSVIHYHPAEDICPIAKLNNFVNQCRELQQPTIVQLRCNNNMRISLEKMNLTNGEYIATQSLLLPDWIRHTNIHAPLRSSNSTHVLLNISRANLLSENALLPHDDNTEKTAQVIVNMEIDSEKRLSPQLELYLKNILEGGQQEKITASTGFSLQILGNRKAWREKLCKLCGVDEEQIDKEAEAAEERTKRFKWWAKASCGVAAGALLSYRLLAKKTA